jgi:hypothetical protein
LSFSLASPLGLKFTLQSVSKIGQKLSLSRLLLSRSLDL